MSDRTPEELVEHIRNLPSREICEHGSQKVKCIICENEDLERENQRYRKALEPFADSAKDYKSDNPWIIVYGRVSVGDLRFAEEVLKAEKCEIDEATALAMEDECRWDQSGEER